MQAWLHRIVGHLLVVFATLAYAQSGRADGVPLVEALELGGSVEQLKAIRPNASCTSYRFNSSADVSCLIFRGTLFGMPTLHFESNFIANRLASATIVVSSSPEAIYRELTQRLGDGRKESAGLTVSWQRDGYKLSLQMSIKCEKTPCEHGLFLETDNHLEVIRKRRDAIES